MTIDLDDEAALPCPSCEYDLRAQTIPRCPECGRVFASLADLAEQVHRAKRIYERVLKYRKWVASLIALAFLLAILSIPFGRLLGPWATVLLLPVPVASAPAFLLLLQVPRWRFSRRIPPSQRRELSGSVPILFIESLPFLCCAVPFAVLLVESLLG
ncbi:MAG: hypothetical protein JXQ75_10740 [Phycisphaerae bacterium]|nr:hypothetical protein [Phycisphaerae bacterium]